MLDKLQNIRARYFLIIEGYDRARYLRLAASAYRSRERHYNQLLQCIHYIFTITV